MISATSPWITSVACSSAGIGDRFRITRFFPLNSSRENAKAAGTMMIIIRPVVATVKISVFSRKRPSGTSVKALL